MGREQHQVAKQQKKGQHTGQFRASNQPNVHVFELREENWRKPAEEHQGGASRSRNGTYGATEAAGMPAFYLIQHIARVVFIIHKGCNADPLFNPIQLPTLHFMEALASH